MIATLILILVAMAAFRVRQVVRRDKPTTPVHPPEGYFFGDPARPTRVERQRGLWGWDAPDSPADPGHESRKHAGVRVDAQASAWIDASRRP